MDIMQKWRFQRKNEKEQLSETLIRLEQHIDHFKHACQAIGKKLLACLQLHGVEPEKRLRKVPESALSKQLNESAMSFDERGAVRKMLLNCSLAEESLARKLVDYEDSIESKVLGPLQTLLEVHIPNIFKMKKQVAKQAQEVEGLKSRLAGITRQVVASDRTQEASKKAEQIREDMEEADNKLELYKDQLATEMFNFHAREGELNNIFTELIESQLKYHQESVIALQKFIPEMKQIEQSARRPVFGYNLEAHLHQTRLPIATVINECITALLSEGLQTEGLFRIAGGATKTKKLKAAFDAGMVDMDEYITDPHCISGALKQYLRELPEPLMTFDLFADWVHAASLPSDQRVKAVASALDKMRKPHFENLKFLIQFLSKLSENAEINKMSSSNLAIVFGPNLLWPKDAEAHNMSTTGVQNAITETLISNATFLFGDDNEFISSSVFSPMSLSQTSHDSSATTKSAPAAIAKVDSSDSLSSDSLGADVCPISSTSSIYGSDLSSVTTSAEADASTLVAPRRTNRKAQAPLPPSQDSSMHDNSSSLSPAAAAVSVSRPQINPGDHEVPSSAESTSVSMVQKVDMVTSSQSNAEASIINHRKPQNVSEPSGSIGATATTGDAMYGAKKSSQFASYQAIVGDALNRPVKTLLSRPNTTYMENAKMELLKTADEQYEGTAAAKMQKGGTDFLLGAEANRDSVPGAQVIKKSKTPAVPSVGGGGGGDTKKPDSWSSNEPRLSAELGDEYEEMRKLSKQDTWIPQQKKSNISDEHSRRKPERPTKPSRPTDSDTNGTKSKPEVVQKSPDESLPKEPAAEAVNTEQTSSSAVGTVPMKVSRTAPPEVPDAAIQQSSGGTGTRPPKPPPPATPGLHSPGIQEDTYL